MSSNEVKIPVSAEFDQRSSDQAIQRLVQKLNTLGDSVGKLNKLKFSPIDRAGVEDLKRMQTQFESLIRISGNLRSRLKATGQEGRQFAEVDWERVYADTPQRGRSMRSAFDYATAGTSMEGRFSAPAAPPAPPPGGGGGGAHPPEPGGGSFPGQGIVNAGLSAAGPAGRVAAGALNTGMAGGMMAGVGALVGGLAALGVSKAVGKVMDKVSDAEQEGIRYDTLKRNLGDVNVSFEMLRGSLRQAAEGLNTNFDEAQKLGSEFTKLANLSGDQAKNLAKEVGVGGGLSRSLGLDLSQGVGFMANMRLNKVTANENDSKRMALMIGEAVGKVGFAKADELMAAVTSFVSQQTRNGLTAANAGGYLGAIAGLAGSGRAGLDVGGSAALLNRVNSSIASGGSYGEASQNFMFATLGRTLGLNPIQTKILQEQGAFGSGKSAFGEDSLYRKFTGKSIGAGGDTTPILHRVLSGLEAQAGGDKDMLAEMTANTLGVNRSQAMALHLYGKGGELDGIGGRLKRAGIGMNQLSETGIAALAKINSGSQEDLQAQAASLRGRTGKDALTSEELKRLDTAMSSGDTEAQRDILTELTATREQEQTEGKMTRDSIEGVSRETQKLATALVPVANTMRDALVAMAAVIAPDSAFGKAAKAAEAVGAREKKASEIGAELAQFDDETEKIKGSDRYKSMSPSLQKSWMDLRSQEREKLSYKRNREAFDDTGQYASGTDALTAAIMQQESGGRRYDANGNPLSNPTSTAKGEMQVLDGTAADPGFGIRPAKPGDLEDRARVGKELLQRYMQIYGGDKKKAAAAYKAGAGTVRKAIAAGGDNWMQELPAEDQKYVNDVMAKEKAIADKRAAAEAGASGAAAAPGTPQEHVVKIQVEQNGKPIAKPVTVEINKPKAAGAKQ